MIYIDTLQSYPGKRKKYAHMMADTLSELHEFAERIGVKKHFFHKDHYDIREFEYNIVAHAGAKVVRPRELIDLRKKLK